MAFLSNEVVNEVRTLRATLGKNGRHMSLKKIHRKTKIPMRQIKYILYERDSQRVKELVHGRNYDYRKEQAEKEGREYRPRH